MIHKDFVQEHYGHEAIQSWDRENERNFFTYYSHSGVNSIFLDYVSIPWLWDTYSKERNEIKNLFSARQTTVGVHLGYAQSESHPRGKVYSKKKSYISYIDNAVNEIRSSKPSILLVEGINLTPALDRINLKEHILIPTVLGGSGILDDLMISKSEFYSILRKLVDEVQIVGENYWGRYPGACVDNVRHELDRKKIKTNISHVFPPE